jgi:hypothetical protein
MSWSFEFNGMPAAVTKAVTQYCEATAASYAKNNAESEEAKDLLTVRDRVVAEIAALDLKQDNYANWNGVNAKGNGSHSTRGAKILSASCSFSVQRMVLSLDS